MGAVVRAARRGRQHRAVRRGDVRQQLPRPRLSPRRRRRRRLRRPRVPPPLLLPAAQREPAPRPLVGHVSAPAPLRSDPFPPAFRQLLLYIILLHSLINELARDIESTDEPMLHTEKRFHNRLCPYYL